MLQQWVSPGRGPQGGPRDGAADSSGHGLHCSADRDRAAGPVPAVLVPRNRSHNMPHLWWEPLKGRDVYLEQRSRTQQTSGGGGSRDGRKWFTAGRGPWNGVSVSEKKR